MTAFQNLPLHIKYCL